MKNSKIKFVRTYKSYGHDWMDIVYHSGRTYTIGAEDAPKTALKFVEEATEHVEQYSRVFNRDEVVHSA